MIDLSASVGCAQPDATAHPNVAVLDAFAVGRLSADELEVVARHLAVCGSCRDYVERVPSDALGELLREVGCGQPSKLRLQSGYEILETIGRGGMGVVYRARQLDLDRIVAFKQIDGELHADDFVRFRSEASAMARLQHPNIVQVYDVGEQDERPYIACEYVAGGGLDRYLVHGPLPVRAACSLVATLARAVHVAHQQSVIHRDLKPSNVLVGLPSKASVAPGAEGFWEAVTPKVADFGLAKLLDQNDSCTRSGALLGTPAYMAPEQTGQPAENIGPPADVYALGVILYETVTGRRPFQGSTVVETLDLVRTAEPVPLRRLRRGVSRDLEVVCLKCLEKDSRRRYATASNLADDLERLLSGEPIRARASGAGARLWKWVRRRPAWAALVMVAALAVAGAVGGAAWHVQRLQTEIERANKNEAEAMLSFRQGYEALDQVIRELGRSSARSPSWRELNDRIWTKSLGFFDGVLKDTDESNPEVRLAKGMLLSYSGSVHEIQGRHKQALDNLQRSRQRLELLESEQPANDEVRYHLGHCLFWLGVVKHELGATAEAEHLYRRAIDLEADLLARGASFDRLRHRLAQAHDSLARFRLQANRLELAASEYEAAQVVRREIVATTPEDNENRAKFGEAAIQLAWSHTLDGKRDRAEENLREAADILMAGGASESVWVKATLAEVYRRWAVLEFELGRLDPAVEQCDRAIAKLLDIQSQDPQDPATEILPATIRMKAWSLSRAGRADEAFTAWAEAITHAKGADRDFYRSERALEQALVGNHLVATNEIAELSSQPNVAAHQWVHHARVYSRAIEALGRDKSLDSGDVQRSKDRYAAQAVTCLRHIEGAWLADPGRLTELDTDIQLAALRETAEYQCWHASVVP
jgi:tetratricopeptide (TPR) repeat protein/tRNA A-37 threonylcarbamoyl transferase component Bud32